MADNVVKLKVGDCTPDEVRRQVETLLQYVRDNDCLGIATVVVRADGTTGVQTCSAKSRVTLLGAVTDLQHTLAKMGDAER